MDNHFPVRRCWSILTVFLERVDNLLEGATTQKGQLTIGEVINGWDAIETQEKLPALKTATGEQHWQTVLDANGIVGPDGVKLETRTKLDGSALDGYPGSQLHVMFDTGFSIPQVSREIADSLYGRIPAAQFVPSGDTGYWRIPCDYELNATFVFGGVDFPISPFDLNMPDNKYPEYCMSGVSQPNLSHSCRLLISLLVSSIFSRRRC